MELTAFVLSFVTRQDLSIVFRQCLNCSWIDDYRTVEQNVTIPFMESKRQLHFDESKSVVFGEPIPLNLQLSDGRSDLQIFANLIAPSGAGLARVQLNHFQGGFYASTSYPMPETPYIFAQYVVESNGQPLTDYEIITETFFGRPPKEQIKWLVGWAMDESFAEGFMVGHEDSKA